MSLSQNNMILGIIQGRLSKPTEGFQECPEEWEDEFRLLDGLCLSHVEWIITSKKFKTNPFFHADISKHKISSVCLDNLVENEIDSFSFLQKNLRPVCDRLRSLKMKNVTIPLLEKSSIENDIKFNNFYSLLKDYSNEYHDINFLLETELSLNKVEKICNVSDNVKITYDTGNTTSYGIEHEDFINVLFDKIENIHLKDRTFSFETKIPGQGDTDFKKIFFNLKSKKYDKIFTLQTAREVDGKEVETVKSHIKILRELYEIS